MTLTGQRLDGVVRCLPDGSLDSQHVWEAARVSDLLV